MGGWQKERRSNSIRIQTPDIHSVKMEHTRQRTIRNNLLARIISHIPLRSKVYSIYRLSVIGKDILKPIEKRNGQSNTVGPTNTKV
jgi:hypothetical protein